jgi:hypothetical protein
VYDIDIIRELESVKIRKAGLARSALTFAVSVAVKPATIYIMPTISINYTQIKHEIANRLCSKWLQVQISHHYRDESAKIMMVSR